MTKHYDALINAPFGMVAIASHGNQLFIDLLMQSSIQENLQSNNLQVKQAYEQIQQYLLQATTPFNAALGAQQGTVFQQLVWKVIAAIPLGKTATYGQIASQVGSGPRAVANACGANNIPLIIPCHRVVAKNGIGGFMQGKENSLIIKRWLLAHEGVSGY